MVEFSVVIPVYNKEPHVARALASVAAQTFAPQEIIVIDDACTDRSIEIIEQLSDDRIRLLKRNAPGPGGYAARNLGIANATSEWIAFLDADDAWNPEHLESLNAALEGASDDVGCVSTCHVIHSRSGSESIPSFFEDMISLGVQHLDFEAFLTLWRDLRHCPIRTSCAAFKRNVLLDVGGFPEDRCQRGGDKDLFLRACAVTKTITIPAFTLVHYNDAVNKVTDQVDQNRIPCLCQSVQELLANANPKSRKLLQDIHNLEVLRYASATWRSGRLNRSPYRRYYVARDPAGYAKLQIMKSIRRGNLTTVRSWLRSLNSTVTRRR